MRVAFTGMFGSEAMVSGAEHPVAFVRAHLPTLALCAAGHDARTCNVVQRPNGELTTLLTGFPDPDLVVLMVPHSMRAVEWMAQDGPEQVWRARATGQVVVVDLADWPQPELGTMLLTASAVTATSPPIADLVRPCNKNVHVLRNMVDLNMWRQVRRTETAGRRPQVGWYGGTLTREDDLATLRGVLGTFLVEQELRFVHVGDYPGDPPAWQRLGVDERSVGGIFGQAPIRKLPALIGKAGIDIGLVPLADNMFNGGKSALKGMEMAAAGIPFIAQAHPEYEEFGAGLIANTTADWRAALERLLDPTERARIAAAGLVRAAQQDRCVRGHEWTDVYESLLPASSARPSTTRTAS